MDKISQKISSFLGSAWVIGIFGLWLVIHNALTRDYVTFISDMAIWIGLLILRAEDVQAKRTEDISRADLKATKRIERKIS